MPHENKLMMFFCQFRTELTEEFQARNLIDHLRNCGMIEDPDNAPQVCDALSSTTYGVNGLSAINEVANFGVCQCFPEDIMHTMQMHMH